MRRMPSTTSPRPSARSFWDSRRNAEPARRRTQVGGDSNADGSMGRDDDGVRVAERRGARSANAGCRGVCRACEVAGDRRTLGDDVRWRAARRAAGRPELHAGVRRQAQELSGSAGARRNSGVDHRPGSVDEAVEQHARVRPTPRLDAGRIRMPAEQPQFRDRGWQVRHQPEVRGAEMSTANSIVWARWATAIAGGLALAGAANAHHSFSVFDMTTEKTIEGDIVEFQWTNPHTWTWVNVKSADGKVTRWGLEGMSPNFLGRRGWSKSTFKP